MKLIVLIPAFNEEKNITKIVSNIPKKITGIKEIEILVIDDGSTDYTANVAMNAGVDKVVSHKRNLGVGAAFMTGIRNAISEDADIVVTLDADSQFDPGQIPELVEPILNQQADVVIGSRFLMHEKTKMPRIKYFGNKIFSKIVSWSTGKKISDSQTGFRAYSREAIVNLSVVNEFTYTQEVLIDLHFKGFTIVEVPVQVHYDENRKSRVVKSFFTYSYRALSIIIRSIIFHRPIMAFGVFGTILCGGGLLAKFLTALKITSITAGLSTGLIILGVVCFMMGMFASVVFKRQAFGERDLRHYIKDKKKTEI